MLATLNNCHAMFASNHKVILYLAMMHNTTQIRVHNRWRNTTCLQFVVYGSLILDGLPSSCKQRFQFISSIAHGGTSTFFHNMGYHILEQFDKTILWYNLMKTIPWNNLMKLYVLFKLMENVHLNCPLFLCNGSWCWVGRPRHRRPS